jgi:type II secretory pathway component PulJ
MTGTRRGFTLPETLVMAAISVLIIGVLYMMWDSSRRQERNVSRHMDVQRGLRGSMAIIQKDLRELLEVIEIEREPDGTLKTMTFKVPALKAGDTNSIEYRFESEPGKPSATALRRNGRPLFQDSLTDFQLFPFTLEDRPREVKETSELDRIHLFKIKLTFLPGKDEFQRLTEQRTFSFSIYPRFAAARRKQVLGRFNLISGRFAPFEQPQMTRPVEEVPE